MPPRRPEVWKFQIPLCPSFEIMMPAGARLLHVGVQDGNPHMWAMVFPDQPGEARTFLVTGTGIPIPEHLDVEYRGTFQLRGAGVMGEFVGHVFERVRRAS